MAEVSRGSFESQISRPESHVVLDIEGDAQTLLVLFGGIAGGVSMPVFEFFRLTSSMPGKKAFFRDPHRAWYQLGIPGIGTSAESVEQFLFKVIQSANVNRVVVAGASAGGFAALSFGARCGADEVLAFSPQTFIDQENRRRFCDDRWQPQIDALHNAAGGTNPAFDLLDFVPTNGTNVNAKIHVSSDEPLDLAHARRLIGIPGIEVIEHERGGHRLVKTLRDRGLLQPLLLQALSG